MGRDVLSLCRRLSPGNQETYRRDLQRYVLPRFGAYRLGRLPAEEIEQWLNDEAAAGIAPSSVHRHYRTLRRMLAVAVQKQKIHPPDAPAEEVEPLVYVADPRLLRRRRRPIGARHRGDFHPKRFGVVAGAVHHDHEVSGRRGSYPSASRRTGRERLRSSGSHRPAVGSHEVPVGEEAGVASCDACQPPFRPPEVPVQPLVLPHGPTNETVVEMSQDGIQRGLVEAPAVADTNLSCRGHTFFQSPDSDAPVPPNAQ